MDQLHLITRGERGLPEAGSADDLAIELHDDGTRVEVQLGQEIEECGGTAHSAGLTIHGDGQVGHDATSQGSSIASAADAESGAFQSAEIAATP